MNIRILLAFVFIFSHSLLFGQGLVVSEKPASDSVNANRDISIPHLSDPVLNLHPDLIFEPGTMLPEPLPIQFPTIDFNQRLGRFWEDFSYSVFNPAGLPTSQSFSLFQPFGVNAVVCNQAAFKISDKITIGGNSYGYDNIFAAPVPAGINTFNSRGASMFFQYKVSKNIKIETRVGVNTNQF